MWKEVPRTRKKEVLSSHHVESSRPSLTTVSLEVEMQRVSEIQIVWEPGVEVTRIMLKSVIQLV